MGVLVANAEERIEYATPEVCRRTGYAVSELTRLSIRELKPREPTPGDGEASWRRALSGHRWRGVLPVRRRDGSAFRAVVISGPVVSDGGAWGTLITFVDAGEAPWDVHAAAQDEESKTAALMGEIHHRVRNNLQIISSLISLQRSVLDDRDSIDVLYDIGARIQSIAIVHDLLYRSASLHRLSFDEFLRELLRHLVGTLPSGKMPPSIELSAGSVELHVGTAVPLGLLVNEILATLLRNTRQEETLDVRLHQADGTVVFEARQGSRHASPGSRPDRVTRVSIEMTEAIAAQLGAGVEWCAGSGFEVSVHIPLRPHQHDGAGS